MTVKPEEATLLAERHQKGRVEKGIPLACPAVHSGFSYTLEAHANPFLGRQICRRQIWRPRRVCGACFWWQKAETSAG